MKRAELERMKRQKRRLLGDDDVIATAKHRALYFAKFTRPVTDRSIGISSSRSQQASWFRKICLIVGELINVRGMNLRMKLTRSEMVHINNSELLIKDHSQRHHTKVFKQSFQPRWPGNNDEVHLNHVPSHPPHHLAE